MSIIGYFMRRLKDIVAVRGAAALIAVLLVLSLFSWKTINAYAADDTTFSETQNEVTISLVTDKTSYSAGETINYTLTVENNRPHYYISKAQFVTTFTEGLSAVSEDSVPDIIPKLEAGESAELKGAVIGNADAFPVTETPAQEEPQPDEEKKNSDTILIITVCAVIAAIAAAAVVVGMHGRKKGGNGPRAMSLILMLILCTPAMMPTVTSETIMTEAAEYDTIKIRPYVKVDYAGTEVMIRMVVELHSYPKRVIIPTEQKNIPKAITCHDPSIFKDVDGTYYIFGTHITGGTTKDLRNWTSFDTEFRATFDKETKEQIRAWNDDKGDWWSYLWAPDVFYNPILKKYCYYLSANGDNWKSNIVMLTSDNVTGPYEYAGTVVYGGFDSDTFGETDAPVVLGTDEIPERYVTYGVRNKKWGDKWPNCIDPCIVADESDGTLWMSYGSWSGGIFMIALDMNTGLRDYSVTYENSDHSDEYFGKKIAGGWYVSGEGSYIQKIGEYYWLFMSYGGLEAKNGYNIRVFRSKTIDGEYVDMAGNTAFYDKYSFNYNTNKGIRLFGGYKWRTFNVAQVAQGHNSAIVDDDGRVFIVYHTRTTDGTEGHTVKVHQLFLNKEDWLVAAPYITDGEALSPEGIKAEEFAGDYDLIIHSLNTSYESPAIPEYITLNPDGTISGAYEGNWSVEEGTSYITLEFNGDVYSGVALKMNVENTKVETCVFTAVGQKSQITVWGSMSIE